MRDSSTGSQSLGRASASFITSWEAFPSQAIGSRSISTPQLSTIASGDTEDPSASSSHGTLHVEKIPGEEILLWDRSDLVANHEYRQDQIDNEPTQMSDTSVVWLDFRSFMPEPLEDDDTEIIRYYFSTVCPINSCFDSAQNFFRTEIKDLMSFYPFIYHSILSMSAAHLASKKVDNSILLLRHKIKAISALGDEIKRLRDIGEPKDGSTEQVLLATIILGMTDVSV